jgi:hypothetical protein
MEMRDPCTYFRGQKAGEPQGRSGRSDVKREEIPSPGIEPESSVHNHFTDYIITVITNSVEQVLLEKLVVRWSRNSLSFMELTTARHRSAS